MTASLNGEDLAEVTLTAPLTGVWTFDARTSTASSPSVRGDAAVLTFGSTTWRGTVADGGESSGNNRVRVVGGSDGLGRTVEPQGWNDASLVQIVRSILAQVGEALSPTVTPATAPKLFASTQFWVVRAESAVLAMGRVVRAAGLGWRMLPDGTVWIGSEPWPAANEGTGEVVLLPSGPLPEQAREIFGVSDAAVLPGTVFRGRRVSVASYWLLTQGDDQSLRMNLLYTT